MASRELIQPAKPRALALSALVLTNSHDAVVVDKVLISQGFRVVRAADTGAAEELCRRQRFDIAVYDQEVDGALDLAGNKRPSSQPRVAVGLLAAKQVGQPAGTRLHFIVHRPFTADLFAKTVKAAYGPITTERRLSFRLAVDIAVLECNILHQFELRALYDVRLVNLSQTGLCLQAAEMLPQGAIIELCFILPNSQVRIQRCGTVVWSHASGRGGIKFNQFDSTENDKLEEWVGSMIPELK